MKITNKSGLSDIIYKAITNDTYTPGKKADISVTQLIGPAQQRRLRKAHRHELEVDAIDLFWAFYGQVVHAILDRVDISDDPHAFKEKRFYREVSGKMISGQADIFYHGVLTDLKTTSVWAVKDAIKNIKGEWEEQLNLYSFLISEDAGSNIDSLRIVAIAKDWNRSESMRYSDYPQEETSFIIKKWNGDKTLKFINERLDAHFADDAGCSDSERWKRGDKYAVMKKGRKSALRVLDSEAEAESWMEKEGKGETITLRPGEYVRCSGYCDVAPFCKQYQDEINLDNQG